MLFSLWYKHVVLIVCLFGNDGVSSIIFIVISMFSSDSAVSTIAVDILFSSCHSIDVFGIFGIQLLT